MDDITERLEPSPPERGNLSTESIKIESSVDMRKKFGYRHVIHLWVFLMILLSFNMRSIMNIAIVSMAGHGPDKYSNSSILKLDNFTNSSSTVDSCPYPETEFLNQTGNTTDYSKREFDWSPATRGLILSSFYYSYVPLQILGGYIVRHIGGRMLMAVSIGGSATCILFHPFAAKQGSMYLVFVRILHGLTDSLSFPVAHHVIGRWAPKNERTLLTSFAWSGINIGIIVSYFGTGMLCEYGFAGGWPSAFYTFGILGMACCVGWLICVRDSPAQHPNIGESEKKYIEQHNKHGHAKPVSFLKIPWKEIALSGPFWGLIIAHVSANWSLITPSIEAPTYLKEILHLTPSMTGILTSIPYVVQFLMAYLSGYLSDVFIQRGLSVGLVRKMFYGIGSIICAASLALITFAGCNTAAVVALLGTGLGMWGFIQSGYLVNYLDIAHQYASFLYSIGNALGTTTGFVIPLLSGYLTNEESSMRTWSTVFQISAIVSVIGAICFTVLGSGEEQPWDINVKEEKPTEDQRDSTEAILNSSVSVNSSGSSTRKSK